MFITFEGPDGSGKTSQLDRLTTWLIKEGISVFTTREPGGTSIGDQIRQVLFDHANTGMHPRTEILLFLASRSQHVEEIIQPRLGAGTVVLCDRYRDSTLAYQGYGHGVPVDILRTLNDFATGGLKPDLTLLLDVDSEVGLRRRADDGDWNRLDAYQLEFHKRVRKGYEALVQAEPDRWVVIDANQNIDQVQKDMRQVISQVLGLDG